MAELHQPQTFDVHFLVCPVLCNMVSIVLSQTLHACFLVGGGQQAACKRPGSPGLQAVWSVCSVLSYWVKGHRQLKPWVAVYSVCQQSCVGMEHAGYGSLPILR